MDDHFVTDGEREGSYPDRVPLALTLLDGVAWRGRPIPGERVAALLAALTSRPEGVSDTRLIDLIWLDDTPANPTKALQVLVSRARTALGAEHLTRYDGGYRLAVPVAQVDALELSRLLREAQAALARGEAAEAAALAARALEIPVAEAPDDHGPLSELREDAEDARRRVQRVLGLALAESGRDADALPHLEAVHTRAVHDTTVTGALLRGVAATAGSAAALERYEAYRADLADRLGVDPDPALQRLHGELLVADAPVRDGVHFDLDSLLGRADDLAALRIALRRSRLVSIVGPGGLGKTRVAHVLAREATQPRVYFVELVGVSSGDDVVAEVGTVLGVRGSMTGRHTLTPSQLADVRSRISAELGSSPSLLVLDNCEHVLESVASLVALLLVTTRDLHVLTTSRAPLGLAAEQVVALRQLAAEDAAELFVRRASAARADADLPSEVVTDIVARLDGLPLAIELAAARVRTMGLEEIRARLGDRFALLRTRDRSAPERHRTLSAVIEWSWDLLDPDAQDAMARLSVFHDGFTREAAVAVLGAEGGDLVDVLAEQSLVAVTDVEGVARFRMLETVREFATDRLLSAGEREDAWRRQAVWARDLVDTHAPGLFGMGELAEVDALLTEENNLADVLRRALGDGDRALVARLLASLGGLWTMTGNHARIFALADAAEAMLVEWDPPDDLREATGLALSWLLVHLSWMPTRSTDALRAAIASRDVPTHPWGRVVYAMFVEGARPGSDPVSAVVAIAGPDAEPTTAQMALLWAALVSENAGDVDRAVEFAREGLERGPLTPYLEATLHGQLSQLALGRGEHRTAADHAARAWPLLRRLHAEDEARAMRVATAMAPLVEGDLDTAERILDELAAEHREPQLGSQMILLAGRAEVALARGEIERGLSLFDEALASVVPLEHVDMGGLSPWVLLAASGSLVARVRHGSTEADARRAVELRDLLLDQHAEAPIDVELPYEDYPLNGVLMAAVGAWTLRYGAREQVDAGVCLLGVAQRWAYNRSFPTMGWEALDDLAEQARPGLLDEVVAEYAGRPAADLVPEARTLLRRVAGLPSDVGADGVTSSA